MRTFIIERTIAVGDDWIVTEDKGDVVDILYSGSALACIAWCEDQGAVRRGPRKYVVEGE